MKISLEYCSAKSPYVHFVSVANTGKETSMLSFRKYLIYKYNFLVTVYAWVQNR